MGMKLNFANWKAPKKESKPVIVKAQQDTSEWFPENWAKELEAAESGTPARTVVEKYNKIIRNPKSVIVYSGTRKGVVEIFHCEGSGWFHAVCANTTLSRYMADRDSYCHFYRQSTREIHDQEHLAANVFGGMISAGFF